MRELEYIRPLEIYRC